MEKDRRPILYKGEIYSKPITKRMGGDAKDPVLSYDVARQRILTDIAKTKDIISKIPADKKLTNEFVVCIRLSPEFSAKSHYPATFFDTLAHNGETEEIGSRVWRNSVSDSTEEAGKMFFVRTTDKGLAQLESELSQDETSVKKGFAYDVRKIDAVNTLTSEEQILGIPDDWKEGRLEAVLHPFEKDKDEALKNFLKLVDGSGVDISKIRYKQYESGITFVSLIGNRKTIAQIRDYNPLRAVHTLEIREMEVSRGVVMSGGPNPASGEKPDVTVGVFDGGFKTGNPYLSQFVEAIEGTTSAEIDFLVNHGTQVTGAVIFGALNDYAVGDTLPTPKVAVKNFRVLPPVDLTDPDLYEVIDYIEDVVPKNLHIKVFNLSLGPKGPIMDDHISRFTFACDRLSSKHNILFTVAVGNDGGKTGDARRIQAPSDLVNGLGVGSSTKDKNGKTIRAPYSCTGPGREGNKLKPDLVAFGGCDQYPIHLVSHNLNEKVWSRGTSFSSPIVAGYAAQLIGYSSGAIDPLVARAMLIHSAKTDEKNHSKELGHGNLAETVEEIVTCRSNSYTLIYKGEMLPGKFAEFQIPWDEIIDKGKVSFRWTLAVSTAIDPHSPDDYTSSSVRLTLYPDAHRFSFTKTGEKTRTLNLKTDQAEADALIADGWKQSQHPDSDGAVTPFATEGVLKSDMKWDSIDHRSKGKMVGKVSDPLFHIHAFERGKRYKNRKIRFAVILTAESSDESIDVYSKIINKYNALVPIKIDVKTDVRIQN